MSSSPLPFLFPQTQSTILPNPSNFFSQNLLSSPLPTNSFFQNFVLKNGDQPEYIHPYLIKSSNSSLSISYPFLLFTSSMLYQVFVADLTISTPSSSHKNATKTSHVISSYSDLSVTLDIPYSYLRFFLVRGADFGFGVYNDHHFHLGYFLYGIAVLAKIDPTWGQKYKPQAYALVTDFLNLGQRFNSHSPRLRCFDLYKLHSWASGLTEFEDGRNQESTSEAVNAYYAAALLGLAYRDTRLVTTASTLTALEIHAAQTWWHVKSEENLYAEEFAKDNRIVGILWANKRDSKLWWASEECRECRLSIQVLPLLPITESLFSDAVYVKELVEWTLPSLKNKSNVDGWKGFTYALQGIYDKENSLKKIRMLKDFDDGNSFSNLLWWIHSR
ncbi:putative glucan endo-1,3-beta-D-glucosidase [Lupinus albus]|uniref:glucan endo-1,3-beta-D-glucosidase n=1 Tax=Lupinus albus TaxID=3870 RepID=A0A6A4PTR2_LUPAL|nr:putative glucan endo-1,3-beta-D-glucosidase [Lupinus albus]